MGDSRRWILVFVVAALVVGLLAYARGNEHFHGDEEGALGQVAYAARALSG